ncbi:methyltransferase type 11 [Echria macrotheca]|uniref:Methyltransferase type 11 n=1 Tax=Echria macrotheca TaxID=438768 RepID=A0AAJ0B8U2_9PEZI|nr:methyltransferase type 11 [Echria macrotheca]
MDPPPKEIVTEAYDQIADWYLTWVQSQHTPRERYAASLLAHLPPPPSSHSPPQILDLGCGPGVPITRLLLDRGAHVTANDISPRQLALARRHCPSAKFVEGDMASLDLPAASFDGVVSFYTIFHLPRDEQPAMFRRIYGWLREAGVLACNLATVDEDEIYGEFLGYGMFWSSFETQKSLDMLREVGFEVVQSEVLGAAEGDGTQEGQVLEEGDPDFGVEFLWVLARKTKRKETGLDGGEVF